MKKLTRRKFVKTTAAAGGATIIGSQFPGILKAGIPAGAPDIVSIAGTEPLENIPKLLKPLGGMETFVKSGNTVGLLLNSPWVNPGTYTSPDVALSVVKQCLDAGAEKIVCFKPVRENYWEESRYYEQFKKEIEAITYCEERIEVEIPNAVGLKKAEIYKGFLEVDVFINIPVAKHHAGTNYSGTLKGLMGISSSVTNRHMHSPDGEYTYDKQEYLAQCIADLALIRPPDLCIVDAIECVIENGPRGPGETIKPNKILAGTDPVALDAIGAKMLDFDTQDFYTVQLAEKHGLGHANTEKLIIQEL
ncbi:MAG: DUF362 domain-containing protein [Bacteroidales bacterium]